MLAGESTNVEQPRLDQLEPAGSKARASAARVIRSSASLASIKARSSDDRASASNGCSAGAALDPPRRLAKQRQRAFRPAEQLIEPGQRFPGLEPGLHHCPFLGQARLLTRFGRKRLDFATGMGKIVAVALGFGQSDRARINSASIRVTSVQAASTFAGVDPPERIEQGAMALRVEQPAIVMLAVDLDGQRADIPQQPGRHCRRADIGAAAAVALQRPPDHQRLARFAANSCAASKP